jgi:hypothetical protein
MEDTQLKFNAVFDSQSSESKTGLLSNTAHLFTGIYVSPMLLFTWCLVCDILGRRTLDSS